MAGRIPARIRVHTATPLIYGEGADQEYVEGERGTAVEPDPGESFACVIFLPGGGEQQGGSRIRTVTQPTMLYNPTRDIVDAGRGLVADQTPVMLSANSEVSVHAPDLAGFTGGDTVRWQLVGEPQPLGPPGRVVAVQATLRQVRD